MSETIVDITKDQIALNQGGSLFIQNVELVPGMDPLVVILPIQAIQSIGFQSDVAVTIELTMAPHGEIQGSTALWAAWDQVSALNLAATAVRVSAPIGAGTLYVTCRTFKV